MKTTIFTLFLFLFSGFLFAQEGEPALASISYEFSLVNDTNNREEFRKEEMIVYLGQYKSLTLAQKMEEVQERMKEMGRDQGEIVTVSSVRVSPANVSQEQLFLIPRENRLVMLDKIADTEYRVDLQFLTIDLEIGGKRKRLEVMPASKLPGDFGGATIRSGSAQNFAFLLALGNCTACLD